MCGISGIYHFGNSRTVLESEVVAMRDTLIHRGPDDAGAYVSPDKKTGFGTRRLKILDLSDAAHMPMRATSNVKGQMSNVDVWITYNGEVYNFRELRGALKEKGHRFVSQSDTEVVLRAYLEWGATCVERLEGMFAFALWDEEKKTLFAARDRMGIKPFYYTASDGTFLFGSEIKAILAFPGFKRELDQEGLSHYLTFGSTPAPFTLFKGIKKLPAGHTLIIRNGACEVRKYWDPLSAKPAKSVSEYIEETRAILRESIRAQMVSDVPFGCFLSGGIDSSTNAKLMSEALGKPVETFSVGYRDFPEKNEFIHSRKTAEAIGINPHELLLEESHMREFMKECSFYADSPVSDQASFPLFWLSKFTKENGVTVVQVGEGADELFAGYEQYAKAVRLRGSWNTLARLPLPVRALAEKLSGNADRNRALSERLALGQEPFWGLAVAFGAKEKARLLGRNAEDSYRLIAERYDEARNADPDADFLKQMTYIELKHRLPEFLLARADAMTMAHSVEARVPFFSTRLVELALSIPSEMKLKGGETKHILKKAVEGIIPEEIINRKKQGFSNPIGEWFGKKDSIGKEMENAMLGSKIVREGIMNGESARSLLAEHRGGKDRNFKLWTLASLSLWYDRWFA